MREAGEGVKRRGRRPGLREDKENRSEETRTTAAVAAVGEWRNVAIRQSAFAQVHFIKARQTLNHALCPSSDQTVVRAMLLN